MFTEPEYNDVYPQMWLDNFRDVTELTDKEKRVAFLKCTRLDYTIMSEKAGHYRIRSGNTKYDLWVSSGKWTEVGTNKYSNDFIELLKRL